MFNIYRRVILKFIFFNNVLYNNSFMYYYVVAGTSFYCDVNVGNYING